MYIQNFVKFCPSILKILSKNQNNLDLGPIKGHNSIANLKKMTIYNTNLDLVHDNVYIKFGYILSTHSQDIEQKPISDINQGPLLCCKFAKNDNLQ